MAPHLTPKQEVDIVRAYTIDLVPAQTIAEQYGRTRQAIYKLLHRHGIEPSNYSTIAVSCQACGKEIDRPRCRLRRAKRIFCGIDCYFAWLEAHQDGTYHYNRHGMRIARNVVSRHFDLQPGHVVHHKDRDTLNNHPNNLMVFANQGDHVRWHRGQPGNIYGVSPLWDGASI